MLTNGMALPGLYSICDFDDTTISPTPTPTGKIVYRFLRPHIKQQTNSRISAWSYSIVATLAGISNLSRLKINYSAISFMFSSAMSNGNSTSRITAGCFS